MVDDLEEAHSGGCGPDFVHDGGPAFGGVAFDDSGEVDGWDLGLTSGTVSEIGTGLGRENEERREGADARVDEAFYSDLGFVELLDRFGSIVRLR